MNANTIRISANRGIEVFSVLIAQMLGNGLTLANPGSHLVTGYDATGDRVVLDVNNALPRLFSGHVGLQLWLNESTDVYLDYQLIGKELSLEIISH